MGDRPGDPQARFTTGTETWWLEIGPDRGADTEVWLVHSGGTSHSYPGIQPTADDFIAWVTSHTGEQYGRALVGPRVVVMGKPQGWLSPD